MLRRLNDLISGPRKGSLPGPWQDAFAPQAGPADVTEAHARLDQARRARAEADHAARTATAELLRAEHPPVPLTEGAVWAQRPPAWHEAVSVPVWISPPSGTEIAPDLTLFHDCPRAEMILRQSHSGRQTHAPFRLSLDTLRFEGSFLSLVLSLPDAVANALTQNDVLRMDLWARPSGPTRLYARLNLQQGPNTVQMLSECPSPTHGHTHAAFDLAYGELRDQPVDRAWIDLIVDRPAMIRLELEDLILSRRPRAEI